MAALGVALAPLLLVLGEPVLLVELGVLLLELLVSLLPELLGVLLPALLLPEAASVMHFSFSAPVRISQRLAEEPTLLLGVLLELLLLGLVALGVLLLVLPLLLPDVWAIDAPEIPSSAAATAAQSVFILI